MQDTISFKSIILLVLKAACLFILVEVSLRLLPACEVPYVIYDNTWNIIRYDYNKSRDGVHTLGNLAQLKTKWHINNMGWNNKYDYKTNDNRKPIIAVIGDSYVEAFHVDSGKNIVNNLQTKIKNYDCYGFGTPGGELSQYLQVSRYVHQNFHPQIMIFIIVDGDILRSLVDSREQTKGLLYFVNTASGIAELPIKPYVPSSARRLLRKFAIARYLTINNNVFTGEYIPDSIKSQNKSLTIDQINKYNTITDYAFAKIKMENPSTKIIIAMDAPRADIYKGEIQSKNILSRTIISNIAYKYGFHVINLTNSMAELYAKNKSRFNYEREYHWNEYGHQVIADQIYRYMVRSLLVASVNNHKPGSFQD